MTVWQPDSTGVQLSTAEVYSAVVSCAQPTLSAARHCSQSRCDSPQARRRPIPRHGRLSRLPFFISARIPEIKLSQWLECLKGAFTLSKAVILLRLQCLHRVKVCCNPSHHPSFAHSSSLHDHETHSEKARHPETEDAPWSSSSSSSAPPSWALPSSSGTLSLIGGKSMAVLTPASRSPVVSLFQKILWGQLSKVLKFILYPLRTIPTM